MVSAPLLHGGLFRLDCRNGKDHMGKVLGSRESMLVFPYLFVCSLSRICCGVHVISILHDMLDKIDTSPLSPSNNPRKEFTRITGSGRGL